MRISFFRLQIDESMMSVALVQLANALVGEYEVEIITGSRFGDREDFGISQRVMVKYLAKGLEDELDRVSARQPKKEGLIQSIIAPIKKTVLKRESKRRMIAAISVAKGDVIISCDPLLHELVAKHANIKAILVAACESEGEDSEASEKMLSEIALCKGFDYFLPIDGRPQDEVLTKLKEMEITPIIFDGENPMEQWKNLIRDTEEFIKRR